MDKATNTIYKGLSSIKYLSDDVADHLYSLRDQQFNSFIDLLNVLKADSRQLDILIKLGFFSEFGPTLTLLRTVEAYNAYSGKKILKKDKLQLPLDFVQQYASSETEKQFRFEPEAMDAMLKDYVSRIPELEIPLQTRLEAELEYLGYISYTDPKLRGVGYVTNVDTKYSPKVTLYNLSTGQSSTYKMYKNAYQQNPFDKGAFLRIQTQQKPKSRMVNGEWQKDPTQTEPWIVKHIVSNDI